MHVRECVCIPVCTRCYKSLCERIDRICVCACRACVYVRMYVHGCAYSMREVIPSAPSASNRVTSSFLPSSAAMCNGVIRHCENKRRLSLVTGYVRTYFYTIFIEGVQTCKTHHKHSTYKTHTHLHIRTHTSAHNTISRTNTNT